MKVLWNLRTYTTGKWAKWFSIKFAGINIHVTSYLKQSGLECLCTTDSVVVSCLLNAINFLCSMCFYSFWLYCLTASQLQYSGLQLLSCVNYNKKSQKRSYMQLQLDYEWIKRKVLMPMWCIILPLHPPPPIHIEPSPQTLAPVDLSISLPYHFLQVITIAEFLRKSSFCDFQIFVVSDQGKCAVLTGTICLLIRYLVNAIYPPDKKTRILFKT